MKVTLPVLPPMPEMRCDAHCEICCSECVPVSELEMAAVVLYANEHDIAPGQDPKLCPWYSREDGRCSVYEARPLVCRAFGHGNEKWLTCDRGYNANVPDEMMPELRQRLAAAGPRTRFLHEVQDTDEWQKHVEPKVWGYVQYRRHKAGLPLLAGQHLTILSEPDQQQE
jgi:Fe-S-cluster containining protein